MPMKQRCTALLVLLAALLRCSRCPRWRRPRCPIRPLPACPAPSACRRSSTASRIEQQKLKTLEARFVQHQESSHARRARGVARASSPTPRPTGCAGSTSSPSPISVVIQGDQMTTWYRDLQPRRPLKVGRYSNQVFKYLGASGNMETLLEYFTVKLAMPGEEGRRLPPGAGAALRAHRQAAQVDDDLDRRPELFLPTRLQYVEADGDTTEYEFRDLKMNAPIPADRFVLKLPKGVADPHDRPRRGRGQEPKSRPEPSMPLAFEILATAGAARRGPPRHAARRGRDPGVHAGGHARRGQGGRRRRSWPRPAPRSCSPTSTTWRCAPASTRSSASAACTPSPAGTARSSPTAAASRSSASARLRKVDDDGVTFRSHLDGSPAALHARGRRRACRSGWASTSPWCSTSARPGRSSASAADGRLAAHPRAGRARAREARAAGGAAAGSSASSRGASSATCASARRRSSRRSTSTATPSAASASASRPPSGARSSSGRRRSCPPSKPRYLMGVGYPRGHPARRRPGGRPLRLRAAGAQRPPRRALHPRGACSRSRTPRFRDDPRPLDPECGCPTCAPRLARLPAPPDARRRAHRGGAGDPPQPALLP